MVSLGIEIGEYQITEEDLMKDYMENWDQHKRMIDASLWSIIVKFKKLNFFCDRDTESTVEPR